MNLNMKSQEPREKYYDEYPRLNYLPSASASAKICPSVDQWHYHNTKYSTDSVSEVFRSGRNFNCFPPENPRPVGFVLSRSIIRPSKQVCLASPPPFSGYYCTHIACYQPTTGQNFCFWGTCNMYPGVGVVWVIFWRKTSGALFKEVRVSISLMFGETTLYSTGPRKV